MKGASRNGKQAAPVPTVDECPQCTTPTRCGRIGDGKRGPRCVGRADGMDDCDCLNGCGDDPWLAKGKAKPCARRASDEAATLHRITAGPTEYGSWFPISPAGVKVCPACAATVRGDKCPTCKRERLDWHYVVSGADGVSGIEPSGSGANS